MQRLFVLVVLSVIVWGCDSSKPDPHDLFLLKMDERILHSKLVLRDTKSTGYRSSSYRDQVLQPALDKVNEYRERVPATDKLRESNVIKHIKDNMNNPDCTAIGSQHMQRNTVGIKPAKLMTTV